ncbi:glycosyltransferase [Williamsia deligens]|uniref:Glycosyltransferase n=1 Tax=Williamsia deligens TaxID=321325 RepID=A0ABW3GCB4_9NOCA|nr:glycosyltransferase [Williamsia deligens]MCP2196186.1 UDP:flavonoid glycosyltransferase YjiC, YdhE family [Williamsia deligens]
MRITIAANGSRGDIQPQIALTRALVDRGHDVVLGVPVNLLGLVRSFGIEAHEFAPDTAELLASPLIARDLKSRNPRTRAAAIRQVTEFGATAMDDALLTLADGADLVVTGLLGQERGATVAEHHGARFVPVHYCPIRPNRSVRVPLGPVQAIPAGRLTGALWTAVDLFFWYSSARGADDALRRRLGMSPAGGPLGGRLARDGTPEIQAYEPALFPELAQEWGPRRPLTGFLGVDPPAATTTDVETSTWIDDGDPPVLVGFGSMPLPDPEDSYRRLVAGITGRRARVLITAGPNLDAARAATADSGSGVRVVETVDHSTVLPRCRAAVHHGGAGTTAACLRAGTPMVIAAFSADQPMWGRVVTDRRLGATLPVRSIRDRGRLDAAVTRALSDECTMTAASFARQIVSDVDAAHNAASILVDFPNR